MDNSLFTLLWFLTLAVLSWKIYAGIRKPKLMLEWPFLASLMWLYFYVYMARDASIFSSDVVRPRAFVLGQLMALVSILAIFIGWRFGSPKTTRGSAPYMRIRNRLMIWSVGMILIVIGIAGGFLTHRARMEGILFDYEGTSAYIYLSYYLGYPGMAICLWIASTWPKKTRLLIWFFLLSATLAFAYPHLAYLRRGPIFPIVLLFLIVPTMARRKSPNPIVYLFGLISVAVVMLVFIQLRSTIYNQGTWNEAFTGLNIRNAVTDRNKKIYDNEFVNHCHVIEALDANGKYQYGTGHFSLFFHWIPRTWWPGKPQLGAGYYSHEELRRDVNDSSGYGTVAGGAAAGGVADCFIQYGFLSPVFWFLISLGLSKLYWAGVREGKIVWLHAYFGCICASHWLVSQGFAASFVPALVFVTVPTGIFLFLGRLYRPRRRGLVLRTP